MQLFYNKYVEKELKLTDTEALHCSKVLRHKPGDTIFVTNGIGQLFEATINEINRKECIFSNLVEQNHFVPPPNMHLLIAPTKNQDRMEWLVEKATEIGLASVCFVQTNRTEKSRLKYDRLHKKALSAMKQSGSTYLPEITELISLNQALTKYCHQKEFTKYIGSQQAKTNLRNIEPTKQVYFLIGPEGDFTPEELNYAGQMGFVDVNLGHKRLRTETAALVATTLVN